MTSRERAALALVSVGTVAVTVAAGGVGGRWWALGVAGGQLVVAGALLGFDSGSGGPVDEEWRLYDAATGRAVGG